MLFDDKQRCPNHSEKDIPRNRATVTSNVSNNNFSPYSAWQMREAEFGQKDCSVEVITPLNDKSQKERPH